MNKTGLVSISFRSLSCEEIIKLVSDCGLHGIEWGSDVHVPPDNPARAKEVAQMMKSAELETSAYGTYYRAGTYGSDYKAVFEKLLNNAVILNAPVMRIWAGTAPSDETDEAERKKIVEECIDIADMAKKENITVAFECHNHTLTDDISSTLELMKETSHGNLRMFWQPNERKSFEYNLNALEKIMPYLTNVHVFNWDNKGNRKPLKCAENEWQKYTELIMSDSAEHWLSLEFMPDDNPQSLQNEAEYLNNLVDNFRK